MISCCISELFPPDRTNCNTTLLCGRQKSPDKCVFQKRLISRQPIVLAPCFGSVRNSPRARKKDTHLAFRADEFVVGAGELVNFEREVTTDPARADHFWITIRAGDFGLLRISISTYSLKHAMDGFDARMRVGVVTSEWSQLPVSGLFPADGLDYAELERASPITYQEMERPALEQFLAVKTRRAIFIEAWGALYLRGRPGIHQVHSRRASCSVRTDYVGRDGAVRFYYRESVAEMMLFKYCGQA